MLTRVTPPDASRREVRGHSLRVAFDGELGELGQVEAGGDAGE